MQISNINNNQYYKITRYELFNHNLVKKTAFKGSIESVYNKVYLTAGYNGNKPDMFIVKTLEKYFPKAKLTQVLDIGAGDGRNSIYLAEKGYNVTAMDIAENGLKLIEEKIRRLNLPNLNTAKYDILEQDKKKVAKDMLHKYFHLIESAREILLTGISNDYMRINLNKTKTKYNFALMSHVTQISDNDHLEKALFKISKLLDKDGILTFDALIRDKGFEHIENDPNNLKLHCSNFSREYIVKTAQKAGFNVEDIVDYNEENELQYSFTPEEATQINNTLKWFVLRHR